MRRSVPFSFAVALAMYFLPPFARALPACGGYDSSRWNDCVGTLLIPGVESYTGEFQRGSYHGRSRLVSQRFATVYSGEFAYGNRLGLGIEYALDDRKLREGVWNRELVTAKYVDEREVPSFGDFWSEDSTRKTAPTPNVKLEEAERRIRDLENQTREIDALRKRNEDLEKKVQSQGGSAKQPGILVVQQCLSRGFKPGSQEFSTCIASWGASDK